MPQPHRQEREPDETSSRPWTLSIDFGSTSTVVVAADPHPTVVEVDGERSMPSVVFIDDGDADGGDESAEKSDGQAMVVGTSAFHLAATRPERALRSPKRRLGSRSPIVVGGEAYSPVSLAAAVIGRGADEATRQVGCPPTEVRLTYPAMWGGALRSRLVDAAQEAGLSAVTLVPEPVAAAMSLEEATPVGARVAVYDLGGGTFDTALVERTTSGFRVVGRPSGTDAVGGELLDEAIMASIGERLSAELWQRIQVGDGPGWAEANLDLLSECRRVKEAVSSHPYGEIRTSTPDGVIHERVTRKEIETIVGPHLDQTIELLAAVIDVADGPLHGIHLVGGGSRMPLVRTMVDDAFPDIAIRTSGDPRVAVAMGAATSHRSPHETTREAAANADGDRQHADFDGSEAPAAPANTDGRRWRALAGLAAVLIVLVGGAAMVNAMISPDAGDTDGTSTNAAIGSEAAPDAASEEDVDGAADLGSERASSAEPETTDQDAADDPDANTVEADALEEDGQTEDGLAAGTADSASTADALGPVATDVGSTPDASATYVVTATDRTVCPDGELQLRDAATSELGPVIARVSGDVELVEGPQGLLLIVERCDGDFVRLRSGSQLSGSLDPATLLKADLSPQPARLELLAFDFVRQILVGDALFTDSDGVWQEVEVNLGDGGVLVVAPSGERPAIVLSSEGLTIADQLTGANLEFLSFGAESAAIVDRVTELRAGSPDLVAAAGCEGDYLVAVFDGITLTFLPDGRFAGWFLRPDSLGPALASANGISLGTTIETLEVAGGRLLLNPTESGAGGFVLQIGDDATSTAGLLSGFAFDDAPTSPLVELGAGQNCAALVAADG